MDIHFNKRENTIMKPLRTITLSSLITLSAFILPSSASAYQTNDTSNSAANTAEQCDVDSKWLSNPSLPQEVGKSAPDGSSNFCDFYQFSTQTFLYLMSKNGNGVRNFQDARQFPLLEFNATTGNPADSCDEIVSGHTLKSSLDKSSIATGQAGGGATIYDTAGKVVYYDVRFDKATCNTTASATEMNRANLINFPSGTTELKFAWKVLSPTEITANKHVTQQQTVAGSPATLGLLGMHIAVATTDHPEFVWATYEHNKNTPDCISSDVQTTTDWTFSSASCTTAIDEMDASAIAACAFNSPKSNQTSPTGTPTNICRIHPYGTASSDLKAGQNLSDISQQNAQIVSLVNGASTRSDMNVLSNYFTVGALWVSDINKGSGGVGVPNERGSLRLANSVAETDYQHANITANFTSNCFGCHNYIGKSESVNNNITTQALSHIFKDIKIGQGLSIDVTASSTIANNAAAPSICGGTSGTCASKASFLKWNGQWTNINSSAGSVCSCSLK
jgi:hypothetical protein